MIVLFRSICSHGQIAPRCSIPTMHDAKNTNSQIAETQRQNPLRPEAIFVRMCTMRVHFHLPREHWSVYLKIKVMNTVMDSKKGKEDEERYFIDGGFSFS